MEERVGIIECSNSRMIQEVRNWDEIAPVGPSNSWINSTSVVMGLISLSHLVVGEVVTEIIPLNL